MNTMSEYPKLISWSYKRGAVFTLSKNDKEYITFYYANNEEAEKAIKKIGYIPSHNYGVEFGADYPSVFSKKEWGNTKRAKTYGKIRTKYRKLYPDLEDKYLCKKPDNGENLNGLIYVELPYLGSINGVGPSLEKSYPNHFAYGYYIKEKSFDDKDFVLDLLNYQPRAILGGEAEKFQNEALPKFLKDLKMNNKDLFDKLLAYDKVKKLNKTFKKFKDKYY